MSAPGRNPLRSPEPKVRVAPISSSWSYKGIKEVGMNSTWTQPTTGTTVTTGCTGRQLLKTERCKSYAADGHLREAPANSRGLEGAEHASAKVRQTAVYLSTVRDNIRLQSNTLCLPSTYKVLEARYVGDGKM